MALKTYSSKNIKIPGAFPDTIPFEPDTMPCDACWGFLPIEVPEYRRIHSITASIFSYKGIYKPSIGFYVILEVIIVGSESNYD